MNFENENKSSQTQHYYQEKNSKQVFHLQICVVLLWELNNFIHTDYLEK